MATVKKVTKERRAACVHHKVMLFRINLTMWFTGGAMLLLGLLLNTAIEIKADLLTSQKTIDYRVAQLERVLVAKNNLNMKGN